MLLELFIIALITRIDAFRSPCPDIFEYAISEEGLLCGAITLNSAEFESVVHLQVELLVTNQVMGGFGKIQIPYTDVELLGNISEKRPIKYRVNFPKWTRITPPLVSSIAVNNKNICKGEKMLVPSGSTHTTLILDHTIKIVDERPTLGRRQANDSDPFAFDDTLHNPFHFKPRFPRRGPIKVIWRSLNRLSTKGPKGLRPEVNDVCGIPMLANSLMHHGEAVARGALPWLVALYEARSKLVYKCCGNLISQKHVITAAHCVDKQRKPNAYVLRFGRADLSDWRPDAEERFAVAQSIHVHPDYVPFTANADIALITINGEVKFTNFIRPLCLWSEKDDLARVVGQEGTVAGWGRTEDDEPSYAQPRKVVMPIVSQEKCLRSAYQYRDITSERTFCAGFRNGSGPCNGDSGGGFVMKRSGRWILRGIVSMSLSSKEAQCDLNSFVVFVDVAKYLGWIMSVIA